MSSTHLCTNQQVILTFIGVFIICFLFLEVTFFSHTEIGTSIHDQLDVVSVLVPPQDVPISQDVKNIRKNRKLNFDNNTKHSIQNLHTFYDPSYDPNQDWFNETGWRAIPQVNFSCPYFENVCVYNQHFYVHNQSDQFELELRLHSDLLGINMPNQRASIPIYKQFFHATVWNGSDEYVSAKCHYHSTYNHLILEASYQTMLGEFYARTLRFLHYLNDMRKLITDDVQLWLLIGDQQSLYVSHHLFTERFSKHSLQHLTSMFDHIPCQCYHRILFCGFHKKGHEIPWPRKDRKGRRHRGTDILKNESIKDEKTQLQHWIYKKKESKTYLVPLKQLISRMEPSEARDIFPEMIIEYNKWIDAMDVNLDKDILTWKYNQLIKLKKYINDSDTLMQEIEEWKFIGLYDRKVRRSWLEISAHRQHCNEKYNKYQIFCHIIVLEDLHSRDVIIIHRASFLLVGVHGAQLTDAIWMKYSNRFGVFENKYVIELLPFGGPKYTNSIVKPTALGVIFWGSHYNHVGLRLLNTSVANRHRRWDETDFFVKWERLTLVLDFLLIEGGGMCHKFGSADRLNISKDVSDLGFAVYNAYCVENPLVWHGVTAPRLY